MSYVRTYSLQEMPSNNLKRKEFEEQEEQNNYHDNSHAFFDNRKRVKIDHSYVPGQPDWK